MRLPRRQFLGLTSGLAATALGLGACSSDSERPDGVSSSSAPAGGPRPELSQWYHEYGEDGVEDAVKRYAAAYAPALISVAWKPGNYDNLVSSALLTDDGPDVFEYGNGPTLDMIKAGQVLDLTDVVGSAAPQFSKPVLDAASWDGRIYAIPQTVDMQMLYYRKSALAAAGAGAPQSMDDLIATAKAVATRDRGGFFAGNDSGVGVLTSVLIWASGNEQINATRTSIGYDNENGHAALGAFRELYASGGLLKKASADWFSAAPLINDETAMQWSGLWILPEVQEALGDDFGVVPFPAIGTAGRPVVPFGAFGAVVSAKGSNPDAAKAFVKWLWIDQEDFQVDFSNSYGTHIPAKTALAPRADKLALGPGAEAARFVNDYGFALSKLWTTAIAEAASTAVTAVMTKNADPSEQVAKVAKVAQAEIKRVNG